MANYANLKSAIQQVIKTNGNNEITGALLQQSLLATIDSLGAGYQFVGIATPTTNPGTPDQRVFYMASTPGVYSNFGYTLKEGEVAIFTYNGNWEKIISGLAALTDLEQKARKLSIVGQGMTSVSVNLGGLRPNNTYRIWIDDWKTSELTNSWTYLSFFVRYGDTSNYINLYTISVPIKIPEYVDVQLPDGITNIEIGGRINSGSIANVRVEDITVEKNRDYVVAKIENVALGRYVNTYAATVNSTTSSSSNNACIFIPVNKGEQYKIVGVGYNGASRRLFALYNNGSPTLVFTGSGDYRSNPRYVIIPDGVTHLAVNFSGYDPMTDGLYLLNSTGEKKKSFLPFFEIGGLGSFRSSLKLNEYVVPGHTYRVIPNDVLYSDVLTGNTTIGVYIDFTTRISDKVTIAPAALSKFYDFTVPNNFDAELQELHLVVRSNFGYRASVFLLDITFYGKQLFPIPDSMAAFMDAVQRKSDNIGLVSSTWNNPYGGRLYGFNRTTVKDLLKATIYVAGNPLLMDIMGATETEVRVWGQHARVVTITNDIPTQLATYYQTLHGATMPFKILANKAGAHANESDLADNGFSLLVVADVSGHYVAAVVGIGNTSQGYTSGRNNRVKGMIELLDIVKAHYDGVDISGMSVVSCEKAIAAELPSDLFPQCYRKDAVTPIHAQDENTIFMPASTSKVMAAITMVDFLDMGEFYRITDNVDELVNDSDYTAYAGDVQSVETSFYAMLMASNGANTLSLARIAGEKILNQTTSLV